MPTLRVRAAGRLAAYERFLAARSESAKRYANPYRRDGGKQLRADLAAMHGMLTAIAVALATTPGAEKRQRAVVQDGEGDEGDDGWNAFLPEFHVGCACGAGTKG